MEHETGLIFLNVAIWVVVLAPTLILLRISFKMSKLIKRLDRYAADIGETPANVSPVATGERRTLDGS